VKPDLTFYIDADPDEIKKRSNSGEERYEKVEFQKRVQEAYGKFKELSRDDSHWVTVEANNKNVEEIHAEILERFVAYYDESKVSIEEISNSLFKDYKEAMQ
jgi:thymidylate kinase